jgi:hypothetical protein
MKRKICWPDPDCTCLEQGCGYCASSKITKTKTQLLTYVDEHPELTHRGTGAKLYNSYNALVYGIEHNRLGLWKN